MLFLSWIRYNSIFHSMSVFSLLLPTAFVLLSLTQLCYLPSFVSLASYFSALLLSLPLTSSFPIALLLRLLSLIQLCYLPTLVHHLPSCSSIIVTPDIITLYHHVPPSSPFTYTTSVLSQSLLPFLLFSFRLTFSTPLDLHSHRAPPEARRVLGRPHQFLWGTGRRSPGQTR